MLGTGNALVTECYNTCFLMEDNGQAVYSEEGKPYYHRNLWIPDDLETIEI